MEISALECCPKILEESKTAGCGFGVVVGRRKKKGGGEILLLSSQTWRLNLPDPGRATNFSSGWPDFFHSPSTSEE